MSVVVPAFNEASRLARSLDLMVGYLARRGAPFEILVVDDGSTDGTAAVVESHPAEQVRLLRQSENRGKGAAVRAGALASRHELVLFSDADLSTPIQELDRLAAHVDEAPVVIASRHVPGASVSRSLGRRLASRVFNAALRLLDLCPGIYDTQCGFKLFRRDVARELFARSRVDGFAFDIELLELARLRGHAILEVGVVWKDFGSSSVSMLHNAPRMLRDATAIRRRLRRETGSGGDSS